MDLHDPRFLQRLQALGGGRPCLGLGHITGVIGSSCAYPSLSNPQPLKPARSPLKRGEEIGETSLNHIPNMSTEREIADKFKEAIQHRNLDEISPYLADDLKYEILPSTFVVIVVLATPRPGF